MGTLCTWAHMCPCTCTWAHLHVPMYTVHGNIGCTWAHCTKFDRFIRFSHFQLSNQLFYFYLRSELDEIIDPESDCQDLSFEIS